jgi:Mini-chromosome maintenance replisome factor
MHKIPLHNLKRTVCYRLVSGVLQLPKGTHLILDETAMTDGQLSARGVQNLTSLGVLLCDLL